MKELLPDLTVSPSDARYPRQDRAGQICPQPKAPLKLHPKPPLSVPSPSLVSHRIMPVLPQAAVDGDLADPLPQRILLVETPVRSPACCAKPSSSAWNCRW